jgi:hypothetical protein
MTKFRFDIKDIEQGRGGPSRLERNHELKSNFRATPEICSVYEGDREVELIMYDLEGSKGARAYPLDTIIPNLGLLTSFRL